MRYIATALILVSAAIGIQAQCGTEATPIATRPSLSAHLQHQPHLNPFMIGNRHVRTS